MARPKRWKRSPGQDGVISIALASWAYFHDFFRQEMSSFPGYIFRAQRRNDWPLLPSFDRLFPDTPRDKLPALAERHLTRFKYAARGRRGPNPARIEEENDWWAIGQHNGLATPLLDWTTSPFVALFFGFYDQGPDQTPLRAVYALHHFGVQERSLKILEQHKTPDRAPIIELVKPLSDENARLVSQGGIFTRGPFGVDLETWVRTNFPGETKGTLLKFDIPDTDRAGCLRLLNRMNINHLSLFPDLYGASAYSNIAATLTRYSPP